MNEHLGKASHNYSQTFEDYLTETTHIMKRQYELAVHSSKDNLTREEREYLNYEFQELPTKSIKYPEQRKICREPHTQHGVIGRLNRLIFLP